MCVFIRSLAVARWRHLGRVGNGESHVGPCGRPGAPNGFRLAWMVALGALSISVLHLFESNLSLRRTELGEYAPFCLRLGFPGGSLADYDEFDCTIPIILGVPSTPVNELAF